MIGVGPSLIHQISPKTSSVFALAAHRKQRETARNHWRPRAWLLRSGGRRRAELGRHQKDLMGFGVESHRARAHLRGNSIDDAEFIRRVFMNDCQRPFAVGAESISGFGIEAGGVCAGADGQCDNDLAGVGVDDHHQFV